MEVSNDHKREGSLLSDVKDLILPTLNRWKDKAKLNDFTTLAKKWLVYKGLDHAHACLLRCKLSTISRIKSLDNASGLWRR